MPTFTPLELGLGIILTAVILFLLFTKFVAKVSPKQELDTLLHKVHPTHTVVTMTSPPGAPTATVTVGTPVASATPAPELTPPPASLAVVNATETANVVKSQSIASQPKGRFVLPPPPTK